MKFSRESHDSASRVGIGDGGWFLSFPPRYEDGICSSKPWMKSHFQKSVCEPFLISPLLEVTGQYLIDNIVTTHDFKLVVTSYTGKTQQKTNTGCFWRGKLGTGWERNVLFTVYSFVLSEFWARAYTIHSKQELNDKKLSRSSSSLQRVEMSCGSEQPGRAGIWPPREWFWFMSCSESCLVWSLYWRY